MKHGRGVSSTTKDVFTEAFSNPVLELIAERVRTRSQPRARTDNARLVLAIEGGGMRGVVSAGMVTALHELGAGRAFDAVIGTSAGAFAGLAFLAEQPALGASISYDDLVSGEFFSRRRLLHKRSVVSLEFLIDEIMRKRKIISATTALQSQIPLFAVATRVKDYEEVLLGPFRTEEEVWAGVKASSHIPFMAGEPVVIDNVAYVDGSIAHSFPLHQALASTPTHILVLLTRPAGAGRTPPSGFLRSLFLSLMERKHPGLRAAHAPAYLNYKEDIALIEKMSTATDPPYAYAIQSPENSVDIDPMEQKQTIIKAGANAGASAVYAALTGRNRAAL